MATIKIPMDGQDIEVPQWATEVTLERLANAIDGAGSTGSKKLDAVITKLAGKSPGDKDSMVGAIGGIVHASDSLGKSGKAAEIAFSTASTAIAGTAGLVGTLAQSKGRFSDLNPVVDAVAEALGGLASTIPFVGGFAKGLIDGAAELVKLGNAIGDDLIDGFDQLTKQGFSLARNFAEVGADATRAGISFATFADISSKNARALAALGGSFDKGADRFINITGMLAREDGQFGLAMRAFGLSATDTAEFLAEFIDSQRGSNLLKTKTDKEVAQAAFDVAKQQRAVAELTGQQADDLKAQQRFAKEQMSFQAMLQDMRNKGEINQATAIEQFVGNLPTEEAQMLAMQLLRTKGSAASSETALLDLATDGRLSAGIMEGFAQIFAAGEEGAIDQAALSLAGPLEAIAKVAGDTNKLAIASLGLLGDGSNQFSAAISKILEPSRQLKDIMDAATANGESMSTIIEQYLEETNKIREGDEEAISKTNQSTIRTIKNLEQAAVALEQVVLQNLGPALELQVAMLDFSTSQMIKVIRGMQYEIDNFGTPADDSMLENIGEVILGGVMGAATGAALGFMVGGVGAIPGAIAGGVAGVAAAGAHNVQEDIYGNDYLYRSMTGTGPETIPSNETVNSMPTVPSIRPGMDDFMGASGQNPNLRPGTESTALQTSIHGELVKIRKELKKRDTAY